MAEDFGFTQIGEELPDSVTLKDVMDTLPKEVPAANTSMLLLFYLHKFLRKFGYCQVFEINDIKAWTSVLISVTSYALGLFFIAKSPWYLLPLAWAWTGTAVTGVSSLPCSLKLVCECARICILVVSPHSK